MIKQTERTQYYYLWPDLWKYGPGEGLGQKRNIWDEWAHRLLGSDGGYQLHHPGRWHSVIQDQTPEHTHMYSMGHGAEGQQIQLWRNDLNREIWRKWHHGKKKKYNNKQWISKTANPTQKQVGWELEWMGLTLRSRVTSAKAILMEWRRENQITVHLGMLYFFDIF